MTPPSPLGYLTIALVIVAILLRLYIAYRAGRRKRHILDKYDYFTRWGSYGDKGQ